MSRFSENLIAGMKLGTAMRTNRQNAEKHEYEMSDAKAKQEDREKLKEGDIALGNFLNGQFKRNEAPAVDQSIAQAVTPVKPVTQQPPMASGTMLAQQGQQPQGQQPAAWPAQGISQSMPQPGQPRPAQNGYGEIDVPDIDTAQQRMYQAEQLAIKYPHLKERVNGWKESYSKAAMYQHQQGFKGDLNTLEGIQNYTGYMAEGAAKLGGIMTPEQAKKNYDYIKSMKQEGYIDALDKFHTGDLQGGIEAWQNSGKLRGKFTGYKPTVYKLGGVDVPGYEVVFTGEDRQTQVINTAKAKFDAMAYEKQVETSLQAGRDNVAKKKTEADIKDQQADNKREDKKLDQSSVSIVQGADDQYVVDTNPASMGATALGIGAKKTAKDGDNGKKWSDYSRSTQNALRAFETGHGITRTTAGDIMQYGDVKDNMDFYVPIMKMIDDKVNAGASDGDAAKYAEEIYKRATALRQADEKAGKKPSPNAISRAQKEYDIISGNGSSDADLSKLWK